MKLRLKENPREWFKFTGAAGLFVSIMGLLLRKRGVLHVPIWTVFVPGICALAIGAIRPRLLRGPYRAVMTVSFYFGKIVGTVLLSVFFLIVITPISLLMRLAGKDLLNLKKRNAETYWHSAKPPSALDRMF
jgi:hypothetical protein